MRFEPSLVVDTAAGEQVVRRPHRTDVIAAALHRAFGGPDLLPKDMTRLLMMIDRRLPQY